jgi:hypothetical protein
MAIDPVRLARIRARLLAASALAVPACGGSVPEHVNERPRDRVYVNEAAPEPKPVDSPINDRGKDTPTPMKPEDSVKTINTPEPGPTTAEKPAPTLNDLPPPGQTINVVKDDRPPHTINTVQSRPTAPAVKAPKEHINTPKPD